MTHESAVKGLHESRPSRESSIKVRRPAIRLTSRGSSVPGIPRHWWGGDPFKTHFLDALSSTFPFGEAFFVRSVRHYIDQIDDADLREKIRLFSAQEGQHSRLHDDHVELLVAQDYAGLAKRNRIVDRILRWQNRRAPEFSLTVTAAIEHLTAILARQVLRDEGDWLGDMDPEMRRLWRWHALEEAEHKAVAFDVLQVVAPSQARRVVAMVTITAGLFAEVLDRMIYMFWKDELLFRGSIWWQGARFLFGRGGFLRGIGREYRDWYRRDFHPDDIDDRPLIAKAAPLFDLASTERTGSVS